MTRPILYTGDIFRLQEYGGITRYFSEVIPRLPRPSRVVVGLHQSLALETLAPRAVAAARMRAFRGSSRLRALVNRRVDSLYVKGVTGSILHPTYYRDPTTLPLGLPVVVTVYDMAHERFPAFFRRRWWNSRDPAEWKAALCARADRIVCISEATRRDLIELTRVPESKTRVIHCGVKNWSAVAPQKIPEGGGIDRPFFLWVGERHTYKNFGATLFAWANCSAARGTEILCVGGGPLSGRERDGIAALGAAERVRQRACSDAELRWAYEHAAGLLYTSRCEGFGLPVLEAMALGCPVVASNGSSLPEVGGEAAIYVDASDPESIRSGIQRCLSDGRSPERSARLAAQAARFSWDACAAAHETLYRELD